MRRVTFVLACLVCSSHGGVSETHGKRLPGAPKVATCRALAALLRELRPSLGWQFKMATHPSSLSGSNSRRMGATSVSAMPLPQQLLHLARDPSGPIMSATAELQEKPKDVGAAELLAGSSGLRCRLSLNVGREEGTWMPKDWAASGARLLLPLDVTFSSEPAEPSGRERLLGPQKGWRRVIPNGEGTFVSASGEQRVPVSGGAWSAIQTSHPSGQIVFRFYLDFPKAAVRNDVELPAGRVYFSAAFWPEAELAKAEESIAALEEKIAGLRDEFSEKGDYKKGNVFKRARAVRAGTLVFDKIRSNERQLEYIRDGLPGSDGSLEISGGAIRLSQAGGLSVKRRKRLFLEEYHVLGTFKFTVLDSSTA